MAHLSFDNAFPFNSFCFVDQEGLKLIVLVFAAVSLTHGVTIQCVFQNVTRDIEETVYACYPATIISDGNLTHVIDVTGNHLSGKTNADVTAFAITSSHEHLNRIPMGIDKFFPNLLLLEWDIGNLTILTADDLAPFPELLVFYAYDNKLVSLDEDLFKHTPKLRQIGFPVNLLEHVGFGLLDNLSNLTLAHFENNPCINLNAETPAAIQELKLQLQDQCPPLATTTTISTTIESEQCPVECVGLIESLEEEIKMQRGEMLQQSEEIARQREENARQDAAILELEKQIKELWNRP